MHYMPKRPRVSDEPRLLPKDYKAGENVVMIGRGRRCIHNEGNKRFRAMVKAELQGYSVGRKAKKSSIIKRILREIQNRCIDGVGFVKHDAMTGRYYTATMTAAKVTIAQAFRDALSDTRGYKSSKQHKQLKRDIARGKIDPQTGAHETNQGLCASYEDEVKLGAGLLAAVNAPSLAPEGVISTESSLQFWGGECIDPLVEYEHAHPDAYKDENCGAVGAGPCLCESAPSAARPKVKEVDPFEPIPLDKAMAIAAKGGTLRDTALGTRRVSECSESSSGSETDDDDDTAMVVWATEFVHCPRCSLVQGRGEFEELPIHDIRKELIG